MKTLLLILLPLMSLGQDTIPCDYKENLVDEFTGNKTITLKQKKVAPGLYVMFARIGDSRGIYFNNLADLGCVSSKSYAILLYTDGSKETLEHVGGIDCDANATLIAFIGEKKEVSKIRVHLTTSQDYVIKETGFIIDGINCIE